MHHSHSSYNVGHDVSQANVLNVICLPSTCRGTGCIDPSDVLSPVQLPFVGSLLLVNTCTCNYIKADMHNKFIFTYP